MPRTVETSAQELITPRAEQAIERGLQYLVRSQRPNGSFGSGTSYEGHVAVTALAGMAMLASGSSPGRGHFGVSRVRAVS